MVGFGLARGLSLLGWGGGGPLGGAVCVLAGGVGLTVVH